MFERYTENARRAIFFAWEEARAAGAAEIGTEHLLLGLGRADQELLARIAGESATEEAFQEAIAKTTGESVAAKKDLPLSKQCKRVLAFSAEEAERLGSRVIGTGHLLLGLIREKGSVAERLLQSLGGDLEKVRKGMTVEPFEEHAKEGAEAAAIHSAYQHVRRLPDWNTQELGKVGFEFYTEQARRAIFYARWEASQRGMGKMEPEHLLLGLWREAAWEINELAGRTDAWPELRERIAERMPLTAVPTSADMALSDELNEVLALAADEAKGMKSQVGVGHLILGLLRREDCFAGDLLRERGAEAEAVRTAVREELGS